MKGRRSFARSTARLKAKKTGKKVKVIYRGGSPGEKEVAIATPTDGKVKVASFKIEKKADPVATAVEKRKATRLAEMKAEAEPQEQTVEVRPGRTAGEAVREARRISGETGIPSQELIRPVTESQMQTTGISEPGVLTNLFMTDMAGEEFREQRRQDVIRKEKAERFRGPLPQRQIGPDVASKLQSGIEDVDKRLSGRLGFIPTVEKKGPVSGFVGGVLEQVKERPLETTGLVALGAITRQPAVTQSRLFTAAAPVLTGTFVGGTGVEFKQAPGTGGKAGVLGSFTLQLGALGVGAKGRSPIKGEKISIRGEKTIRTITVSRGAKAQPLISLQGKSVKFGTPKVELKGFEGEFPLATGAKGKIIETSLKGKAPLEAQKIKEIKGLISKTKRTKTKFKGKLPTETEALNTARINKALDITKAEKGKLFGSFPQQAGVAPEFVREVGDIDIKLPVGAEVIPSKAEVFRGELAKIPGPKVLVRPDFPGIVQVQKGGRQLKGIELKPSEGTLPGEEIAPESFLGLSLTQRPIKIQGVKASRLSEQGLRKAASIGTLRKVEGELVIGPKPRRGKDIADFFRVQESLIQSIKSPVKRVRARTRLERLKVLFPEGAAEAAKVKEPFKFEFGRGKKPGKPISPSISSGAVTSTTISKIISPGRSQSPGRGRSRSPSPSPSKINSVISGSPGRSKMPSRSPLSKVPSKVPSPRFKPPSPSRSFGRSVYGSRFFSKSPGVSKFFSTSPSPSVTNRMISTTGKGTVLRIPTINLKPPKLKEKGRLRRPLKYQPSLVAAEYRIFGKKPKELTGLEIRKIPV